MTASTTVRRLTFADPGEAAGFAALLQRLVRWEKNASVRVKSGGGHSDTGESGVVGVFAKPARFEVLAIRTARLLRPTELDSTVAAGELLESVDEGAEAMTVPSPVTGPSWAGVLPPRSGWQPLGELPTDSVRTVAAATVKEFRERAERLTQRDRGTLDELAEEIWSRPLGRTELPLRAVHAAHALGFLHGQHPTTLLSAGSWLRLRTRYGSVAVRTSVGPSLSVTPTGAGSHGS
ncbi:hypothetical protein JGS22_015415 [Streptomyces sp. P38-E01]|uniref:Uncharacterized protein n=1 Tax=Streptomyces tardus TaxID=2780544 RepID=A0A949JMN1_9ACTN|nr:hypothetical protein [Streptomyces tardus]MBU7598959.1 hypothetical protein [Streptomyces tardus]